MISLNLIKTVLSKSFAAWVLLLVDEQIKRIVQVPVKDIIFGLATASTFYSVLCKTVIK